MVGSHELTGQGFPAHVAEGGSGVVGNMPHVRLSHPGVKGLL